METLVHEREKLYFWISIVVSAALYLALVVSVVGIFYLVLGLLAALMTQGFLIGSIRGNSIKVSSEQFPDVDRIAKTLAAEMGLNPVPDIYIVQAGGLLNAFATRFLGRNFVIIYSDVLELAYQKGEGELAFIVAHEFGHILRKHLIWRAVLLPAMLIPYLSGAYSRACEYTCDRYGARFAPQGAVGGLLVLAAGKKLYLQVNAGNFESQVHYEKGFWVWYAELLSTHPYLPKRVQAVRAQLRNSNTDQPKSVAATTS